MRDGWIEIRIVTPIVTSTRLPRTELALLEFPGVKVTQVSIAAGPASIESEFEIVLAAPDTVARAIEAEREGADAVIIDCMGDPALRAAREAVRIPVVGPAQASMHVAALLGQRFGVINTSTRVRAMFENSAALAGLGSKLVSIRSVEIPVLELEQDLSDTQRRLVGQALAAVENDGAEVIIFGCTGLLGCADAVRDGLKSRGYDVPVIDPIPNAVAVAAGLVRTRLTHSLLTYPTPPRKQITGYERVPQPGAVGAASDVSRAAE
jgi:allantoin racemase